MSVAACLKRVSGLSSVSFVSIVTSGALLMSGCTSGPANQSTVTPNPEQTITEDQVASADSTTLSYVADAQSAPTASTLTVSEYLAKNAATSQKLVEMSAKSPLALDVYNQPGVTRVLVNTGDEVPTFNLSELSAPNRLVLDLPNTQAQLTREFALNDSEFVSKVRIGAHGDKERVVLDLINQDSSVVKHQVDVVDGAVVLTVSNDLTQAALDMSNFGSTANDTIMAAPNIVSEKEAPVMAAPPVEEEPARLTGISIEQTNQSANRVVASLTATGTYKLEKSAPSEYVLTLKGATLDDSAKQPLVAPPQAGAIRSVRALQQGGDILLRIFAEPNATLAASAQGERIYVTAASQSDNSEPLAQLKDESSDAKVEVKDVKKDQGKSVVTESSTPSPVTPTESQVSSLLDGTPKWTGRLISLDLQDTDIDNALRIIAEVSNLNIIASGDVTGKVTLRLIDVPWDQALDVILKTNGLDKVQEGNVIRVAPVEKLRSEREALKEAESAKEALEPLEVKYVRVSYAKASDVKPLVETVLSERGSVATDERTNQLIVKDIQKGIINVAELIKKLDLRTPQVLLETQIVEAQRTLARDLGTELGFEYIQSPATGNATGYNFPNSVTIGGSVTPNSNVGSSFPAALGQFGGSAVSALFGSADGSKSLELRLSSLEREGRVRILSRPSVATINNKQAIIKSVEKIRVRTPDSGLSVATGQGASASGGSSTATETFEVGITLEVTPQASPDFYVLLDINAKSSTLGATVVDGIPSEIERSATSTVLVSSGQTFALGGIYKISDNDTLNGVPFLKDIPFLGHLFRRSFVDNKDEELIFFLTPRIVEGSFDDAAMQATT